MATVASSSTRRIACLQFDSKHADVARNTGTVLALVSKLIAEPQASPVHLVVLPELALTGYVFESRDEIDPLLEDARNFTPPAPLQHADNFIAACTASCLSSKQPSLTLAAHLAHQLHCHVVIGFPEIGPKIQSSDAVSPPFDARPHNVQDESDIAQSSRDCAFNSAALVAPDGSLKHVFRKHFLFESDQVWASQGSGFQAIHLPLLGSVCVAICMDLNPFQFQAPFESCELASFCSANNVDLLVMPMAWLLPKHEQQQLVEQDGHQRNPAPSLSTINYWALRCRPLFDAQHSSSTPSTIAPSKSTYLVATNRCGNEANAVFAGSSCILQMNTGKRPLLLDSLGTTEQACLVVDLPA
ncbi:related to NTA1-Amidase [Sporisorium reilianum f. sp. reilianum]|uniref:Related to NTA1-Amidase n=1 Tax=Sporisorium reilianum f. sp. reilianum TaxID=72559 RepID=A0A2N8UGN6_9BASI|nr:related to NTA1-Amidase [Sporisorium reilianum f. sp. reilianum]